MVYFQFYKKVFDLFNMAARRFVKSSVDWAAFAERVPAHEKQKFQQFKAKVDNYTKK